MVGSFPRAVPPQGTAALATASVVAVEILVAVALREIGEMNNPAQTFLTKAVVLSTFLKAQTLLFLTSMSVVVISVTRKYKWATAQKARSIVSVVKTICLIYGYWVVI